MNPFTWRQPDDVVDPEIVIVKVDRRGDLCRHIEAEHARRRHLKIVANLYGRVLPNISFLTECFSTKRPIKHPRYRVRSGDLRWQVETELLAGGGVSKYHRKPVC